MGRQPGREGGKVMEQGHVIRKVPGGSGKPLLTGQTGHTVPGGRPQEDRRQQYPSVPG